MLQGKPLGLHMRIQLLLTAQVVQVKAKGAVLQKQHVAAGEGRGSISGSLAAMLWQWLLSPCSFLGCDQALFFLGFGF